MAKRPPHVDDDDAATAFYDGPRAGRPAALQVISMKTPAEVAADVANVTPELQRPQLRPIPRRHPTPPSGNLAPPRGDVAHPTGRTISPLAWGAILAIGGGVGLAIWLLSTR